MPQVRIRAFDEQALPSQILVKTWIEEWQVRGGTWDQPLYEGNTIVIQVDDLDLGTVESAVTPTIDEYNGQHPGNDELTATFSG